MTARTEAKALGMTRYDGKPCRYGHGTERLVSTCGCARCRTINARAWQKRNPVAKAAYARSVHLKTKFGITPEEYDAMLHKQRGKCAICRQPEKVVGKSLAVDHDHKTGKVRGLLCGSCNQLLGIFEDRRAEFNVYLEERSHG